MLLGCPFHPPVARADAPGVWRQGKPSVAWFKRATVHREYGPFGQPPFGCSLIALRSNGMIYALRPNGMIYALRSNGMIYALRSNGMIYALRSNGASGPHQEPSAPWSALP